MIIVIIVIKNLGNLNFAWISKEEIGKPSVVDFLHEEVVEVIISDKNRDEICCCCGG